jgi:alpha-tubulin suppressor-like RCC1 family protein
MYQLKLKHLLFIPIILICSISEIYADHFSFSYPSTLSYMNFYGDVFTIDGTISAIGDEIAIFDQSGTICGHYIVTNEGGYFNIVAYGDDSATSVDEGPTRNENLIFKIWDSSEEIEITLDNSMYIQKNVYGISQIETIPPKFLGSNEIRGMGIAATTPLPAPTIDAVFPATLFTTGGDKLTITGYNFEEGASVNIDGMMLNDISFISCTQIACDVPPHDVGNAELAVINPTGMSDTYNLTYEYPPPEIINIYPENIYPGETIQISGMYFQANATIYINGITETNITSISYTTVTCTIPFHVDDTVEVLLVNPDGKFDSYTIYVNNQSNYQFTGRIPDTGQTKCYDNDNEIPCPNPGEDFYGQDANYNINPQSFSKLDAQANELPYSATEWTMVRDNVTGLIWEVKTDDGSIHDKDNTYTWYDSNPETNGGYTGTNGNGTDTEDFIKSLNESNYGGFSDWRLPSLKELVSIVHHGKHYPATNESYFPKTMSAFYWSSTSDANNTGYAWGVDFNYGLDRYYAKDSSYFVRAVRGGQCRSFDHSVNLVINTDETVTDTFTGLIWQKESTETRMTWQNAVEYCENMSLSDYNDWRLPTMHELRSIVNYLKYYPAMNQNFFSGNMSAFYWSSTSYAYCTRHAWGVHFYDGLGDGDDKYLSYYVRAVRGGQNRLFGHLVIGSPEQGSKWQSGDKMPIKWDTQNIEGNVKISISREGGKTDTFIPIASNTPNDGKFEWTVTQQASVNCMLKIEPVNEPDKGTTQGLFSITSTQPQTPVLSLEETALTLNHMTQTMFTVSDTDSDYLTLVAFSSDQMLIPDAFINLGNLSNINHIHVSPGEPVYLSLTCYQADKNYGQAIITVEVYDESGLSASQQISVSVSPIKSLACECCEITQTMGMVAAGESHYLILKTDGTVWEWVRNAYGQYSFNNDYKMIPVPVQGLSGIIAISSGAYHNLALRSDGTVWAWGANGNGQLGIGNTINKDTPVQVSMLADIVAIDAGGTHSLALQANGTVWTWGDCNYENSSDRMQPVQISELSRIVAIAAGGDHNLALKADGTVWSWGNNWCGQLGNGSFTEQYIPSHIPHINQIIKIDAGSTHSMALHQNASIYSWGDNWVGQLGNGHAYMQTIPEQLQTISNVIDIECGNDESFAMLNDGNLMAWGYTYGNFPKSISPLNDIIDITSFGNFSFIALTRQGSIKAWGYHFGFNRLSVYKEVLPDSHNIQDISSDSGKTCMALKDGTAWCWGTSIDGMYGLSSHTPLQITELHNITAFEIESYTETQTALGNDGTVWKWGENNYGQLGNGTTVSSDSPIQVHHLENVISVSSDSYHSLALINDGSVWAWGLNASGQLGDGTTTNRHIPIRVLNIDNIVAVSSGAGHSLALKDDGSVWAWGLNWNGQLGDGTIKDRHEPFKLNSLSDIVAIRSSEYLNLALKSDGSVWTWGNNFGQSMIPRRMPGLENIIEIDMSGNSCIARASNNDIWVWGKIWNNDSFDYHHPILMKNIPDVSKIKAGHDCFYFFRTNGSVWIWGFEKFPDTSEFFNVCSTIQIQSLVDYCTTEDYSFTRSVSVINATDQPYTVSVLASNPFLIYENAPQVYQNQNEFELIITPRSDQQYGQTSIVVVAEDSNGYATSTEFVLTVYPEPDPPELSMTIPEQITISQGTAYTSPMFFISDVDTEPSNLTLSISSSNESLLPDDQITYHCNYDNCYLNIPPITEHGTTEIVLILSDSTGLTSSESFSLEIPETKFQKIYLEPDDVNLSIGDTFSMSVMYDVSDKDNTLVGLATRIHYDSNILTFLNATNYAPNYISSLDQIENPENSDSDPNTDRMIVLGWADVSSANWPNKNLPCQLVDLAFEVKTGITSNHASINTGFTSLSTGYEGRSENATIHIDTRQPPELTFNASELTLNHMTQTMFTVSDPDSDYLTLVAFSSDQMLIPDAFITLGNSGINHIGVRSALNLSLTCYQADKNYGQAIITVEAYDDTGLSASQQISVSVSPFHSLACENCEISQTMGMVAAGYNHYLALKPDGRVLAWGDNYHGQLGTGDKEDRITPVLVQGLSNIISIQSGYYHNLALRSDGTVWSWGYNYYGQLGIGNTTGQSSPVQIVTLNNIVAIAAGSYHSLALQEDGTVWAWGRCYYENSSNKTQPVKVSTLSNVVAIAAGYYHSLALKADGSIWSWGRNYDGQLGNGNTTHQYTPIQVGTLNNIISISAGYYHSMALHSDGTIISWGYNRYGQLGNGNKTDQYSPVQVQNISTAIDIECSAYQSFARLSDGSLMAWGEQYTEYPQPAQNMDDIVDWSGSLNLTMSLTTSGNIKIWDRYPDNQIPVFKEAMPDSHKIRDISSGPEKTCVAYKDGTVWCWGDNIDGLFGLSSPTPLQITQLHDIIALETGNYSAVETVLRSDGTVWNWGGNWGGQLGNGTTESSPVPVEVKNLDSVTSVKSAFDSSLALKEDGSVWAWGSNYSGQLGDGTTTDRYIPIQVLYLDNIVAISAGWSHSLALKNDGTVWAWGANWNGQLGDGTTIERHEPVKLNTISDVTAIRSSEYVNLALKSDGTVWTWGSNNSMIPRRIPNLENIVEIDISGESFIARGSNGDIWAWGRVWNISYFGDYHQHNKFYQTPIFLKNIPGVSKIIAGYHCFYFFMPDGSVWMWGVEKNFNTPELVTLRPDQSSYFNVCSKLEIHGISNQQILEDETVTVPISFISETGGTYTVSVHALNPLLVFENEPQVYQNPFLVFDAALDIMPRMNQDGQTNIVIVAEDSNGDLASAEFILTIDPVNDTPVISSLPDQVMISQGSSYTSPVFYVSDENIGNVHFFVSSSNKSLLADDDLTIHCNYDNCYLIIPPTPKNGSTDVIITASDSNGFSAVTQFSLEIVYTIPTLAVYPQSYSMSASPHILPITITNTNENSLTMNWRVIPQVDWIRIKENASGTDNGLCLIQLSQNPGNHSRSGTILVQTDAFSKYVHVYQWPNQAPSIRQMGDWYSFEDQADTFLFQVIDSESDASDLTIIVDNFCPDLISSLSYTQNIQDSLQSFSIMPVENASGACVIAITVTDHQLTLSESFMISIVAVDDPPEISHIPDQKIIDDTLVSEINFQVNDIDSDPSNIQITASASNPIIVPQDHIFIGGQHPNRHIRIFPTTNDMGSVLITMIAISNDLAATSTFTLSFNTPPVAIDKTVTLVEDEFLYIPLIAQDAQGDPLTYTIVDYPSHGNLVLDNEKAIVAYTPFPDYNLMDQFSFIANDGYADSNVARVVLTITPENDPPIAEDLIFQTSENTSRPIYFAYTDIDGDTLTPRINIHPNNGQLSPDFVYTPDEWFWGTDHLVYSLSDGEFTSNTATVSIVVNRANAYTLSMACPKGVGEIEINGSRILLPWQAVFASDREISIKAISTANWIFNQWQYDQTISTDNPLEIVMDRGKTITVQFVPPTRTLTLLGYQSVKINGELFPLPLEKAFYQGDILNMHAVPQNIFKGWSGDIDGHQNPIEINIQSNMTIGALFENSKEWELPIQIETVDLPQTYSDTITIGVSLFAETQPYQIPEEYGCSMCVFSTDWQKHSQLIQVYQSDQYRWTIGVNPHGNIGSPAARTSRLYWNPADFSDIGGYQLFKGFDQNLELVIPDMRAETSYEVTDEETVLKFTIIWSSQLLSTVTLETQLGWNLISLPVQPLNASASILFPDTLIYAYENGAYVRPERLEPGKGYWIKAITDKYELTGEPLGSYTTPLTPGWHLVGGLDQPVDQTFDSDCCAVVFGYQNGAYVVVSKFELGRGYWVKGSPR